MLSDAFTPSLLCVIVDVWFCVTRVSFKHLIEVIAPKWALLYNQSCKMCEDTHLFVPTVLLRGNQSDPLNEGIAS